MKVQCCDVCLSEGKITFSTHTSGFKGAKVHVCREHLPWSKQFSKKEDLFLASCELENKGITFLNSMLRAASTKVA